MEIKSIIRKIKHMLGFKPSREAYWNTRVERLGERSVISIKHDATLETVTKEQEEIIFPILKSALTGKEKTLLDFGCGYGRFTSDLAKLTGTKVIGADSTSSLIELAKKKFGESSFVAIKKDRLPFENESIDIIFICLVMGGISDRKIKFVLKELNRVLAIDGLLLLVENTSRVAEDSYWTYRSANDYQMLFDWVDLSVAGSYKEIDEDISIMIGRKSNKAR